jgi:hypothetical protein
VADVPSGLSLTPPRETKKKKGPFGYKFKVDDTPDVEKADQHYFDLGL